MPVLTDEMLHRSNPAGARSANLRSQLTGFGVRVGRGGAKAYFVFWRSVGKNKRQSPSAALDKGMRVDEARAIALRTLTDVKSDAERSAAERRRRRSATWLLSTSSGTGRTRQKRASSRIGHCFVIYRKSGRHGCLPHSLETR